MPLSCENMARYQLSGLDHLAETGEPSPPPGCRRTRLTKVDRSGIPRVITAFVAPRRAPPRRIPVLGKTTMGVQHSRAAARLHNELGAIRGHTGSDSGPLRPHDRPAGPGQRRQLAGCRAATGPARVAGRERGLTTTARGSGCRRSMPRIWIRQETHPGEGPRHPFRCRMSRSATCPGLQPAAGQAAGVRGWLEFLSAQGIAPSVSRG